MFKTLNASIYIAGYNGFHHFLTKSGGLPRNNNAPPVEFPTMTNRRYLPITVFRLTSSNGTTYFFG